MNENRHFIGFSSSTSVQRINTHPFKIIRAAWNSGGWNIDRCVGSWSAGGWAWTSWGRVGRIKEASTALFALRLRCMAKGIFRLRAIFTVPRTARVCHSIWVQRNINWGWRNCWWRRAGGRLSWGRAFCRARANSWISWKNGDIGAIPKLLRLARAALERNMLVVVRSKYDLYVEHMIDLLLTER